MDTVFSKDVLRFVETAISEGKVGICGGTIRVLDIRSGAPTVTSEPCGDRFMINIPYAGQSLSWEVLFNSCYPDDPPDFIFSDEDADFLPDIDHLPSLVNWNPTDPRALLNVVDELLQEYRLHQQKLVDSSSRLQFEYSSLIENTCFTKDHVEVHVSKKGPTKIGPINFLIKMPVDLGQIPPYLVPDNPGDDSAVLLVQFHSSDCSRATPQLYLSPRVEHALGGGQGLRIPPFPSGGCLMDYVPNVCELLANKVDQIVQGHEKKKEYVSAFLSRFGRSVIEYDTESFSKISFLYEWHDFFFILTVDLPILFPIDQPTLTFQSVYHESQGRPYMKIVRDFPYSPRWKAHEMAERTQSFIVSFIPTFQKSSVREGSL